MFKQAYICGSYTAANPAQIKENIADALRAGLQLSRLGFFPLVPHVAVGHRMGWEAAMERCRVMVATLDHKRGDILVVLPGWEQSRGAREEVVLANRLDIPVKTLAEVVK